MNIRTPTLVAAPLEVSLTPAGQLVACDGLSSGSVVSGSPAKGLSGAFSTQPAAGLFALAVAKPSEVLSPSAAFWREFACRYLTELCRTPESVNGNVLPAIDIPDSPELQDMLSSVPPMRGAEYLNEEMLADLWTDLDRWVHLDILANDGNLADWLKKRAPLWHQVGRVCFHLAENKRDANYPFAFLATYAPKISTSGRVQYQPLSRALEEYAGDKNNKALISLLSPVHLASQKSAFVKELVESNDIFHPLVWKPDDAYRFLKDIPLLEDSGVLVRVPDWWRKHARPRVTVTIGDTKQHLLALDSMIDFRIDVALGDANLTRRELQEILNSEQGLVYLKGNWIEVDRERLSEALHHWKQVEKQAASGSISFAEGMRLLAGASDGFEANDVADEDRQWSFVKEGKWLSEILTALRNPQTISRAEPSKNFRGTLRPYQQTGLSWLRFLSKLGLGACLADDMGLGKTVQIITLLLAIKDENRRRSKPSLLILPASLLSNWKAELRRFAPTLRACFLHPSETDSSVLDLDSPRRAKALGEFDVVATTYGVLLRQSWLLEIDWGLVILDEAQAIKNPSSQQTRAVKKLKSESRIALTGTPVENRLSDLWSLFDFLAPGLLGSADKFKQFVKKLDDREHRSYAPLRKLVSPYILRRLKSDKSIISDLPDKTELNVYCGLTPPQAALYAKSVEELKRTLNGADGMQRRGLVLAFLMRFKQICNHPSQVTGDGAFDPEMSGKLERLRVICDEIASRQEKVLVFTQFREMTEPIADFLKDVFGRPGLVLHGGTAVAKRKGIVDAFQQADGPPFAVLSLKAGGTGLNLTAASHVVHFDRWWNPAVENQATDRAYRIGQHRNVLVHKFICRGTIEEKIDKLISEKSALSQEILAGGAEAMLTELNDKDLIEIVSLDLDRVSLD